MSSPPAARAAPPPPPLPPPPAAPAPTRLAPFIVAAYAHAAFDAPPAMAAAHAAAFRASLAAATTAARVAAARLWEDELLPAYRTPFFLVRVADVRAALNSPVTAHQLYEEARARVPDDPVFAAFVAASAARCAAAAEHHRSLWARGQFHQPWAPQSTLLFPILPVPPARAPHLRARWAAMRAGDGVPAARFLRYLCVQNNTLELAFLLTARSVRALVRDGFDEAAVDYARESALQDKALIIRILRDTHAALNMVLAAASAAAPAALTTDFLCALHRACMATSRLVPAPRDGAAQAPAHGIQYISAGLTRAVSCKNVLIPGPPRVQFCPFERVADELERFLNLARQWLRNWRKNAFATAAWMHLVFTACHPFEDGNGRVARLLASLPLLQDGLPPLCIPIGGASKKAYLAGLGEARARNYEPLVECFAQALDASVETVEALDGPGMPPALLAHGELAAGTALV